MLKKKSIANIVIKVILYNIIKHLNVYILGEMQEGKALKAHGQRDRMDGISAFPRKIDEVTGISP